MQPDVDVHGTPANMTGVMHGTRSAITEPADRRPIGARAEQGARSPARGVGGRGLSFTLAPLARLLRRGVVHGSLTLIDPAGRAHLFGHEPRPSVRIRIADWGTVARLWLSPGLSVGEAYTDGRLIIEDGTLRDFLNVCVQVYQAVDGYGEQSVLRRLVGSARRLRNRNPLEKARANAAHHYDLPGALYDLFLDTDRQYSCAYFPTGGETLEEAQAKKKLHLATKLLIKPGMRILDIGSGWGGLALDLARQGAGTVTGLTLSQEQLSASRARAADAGLADRVAFHLRDYREERGTYDRVVSVGMLEHVGAAHYDAFFGAVRRLLRPDGVALIHAIGRMEPPGGPNPWLRKHIFPGGYCPALSEVLAGVERTDLWVTDVEILRLHYAETLRHWFDRFEANRETARALYGERFCRMWEFYLAACEAAFREGRMIVFQIQLARARDAVPLSRGYMYAGSTPPAMCGDAGRTG